MKSSVLNPKYFLLYVPFALSIAIRDANICYLTAWFGSFFIFFMSMSGKIKPLPNDLPLIKQLLRPLFLTQAIFAGYMACTSIFFYLNTLGYTYFEYTGKPISLINYSQDDIAFCQSLYVLGHAAFVHGVLLMMNYPVTFESRSKIENEPKFLIMVSLIALPASFLLKVIPGLNTFSVVSAQLSFVAGTLALASSISKRQTNIIVLSAALFAASFIKAMVSGYKEPIIVSLLILGIFLLPVIGKKLLIIFVPVMVLVFSVLPTYVTTFREINAAGGASTEQAQEIAINAVKSGENLKATNWAFLVTRLSEISMFIQFSDAVPKLQPFYGLQIVGQSAIALVPRVLWPSKPDLEILVMDRVYDAGVIDPTSYVSAKPATIVDGYLSGGALGVWLSLMVYGLIAQLIALKAEKLFGGFYLGTALVYTSFFQIFWRGNCFEFLTSTVFWAIIGMYIFHFILKKIDLLEKLR